MAGRVLVRAGEAAKDSFKKLVVPGMFFEDMGIKYLGPIDGHNMQDITEALVAAQQVDGPVLVHAITQKGRGFEPAEQSPELFHGVSCYDPNTGEPLAKPNAPRSYTEIFSASLLQEAAVNQNIVAITAGMRDGTGLTAFGALYPDRFFDVGIAEEHAVALAAGLALGGKTPVVALYSTFLQRAFDQIVIDVALQKQHVVFCIDRAGLVGEDGSTHHGMLDLAFLRTIPNLRIMAPSGAAQLRDALHTALALNDGPVAIRYPRGRVPACDGERAAEHAKEDAGEHAGEPQILPFAQANKLRDGTAVALLALGNMVPLALTTAQLLADAGIEAAVYDMLWVSPLDEQAVTAAAATKLIVTLEDGTISGGFGSAVLEVLESQHAQACSQQHTGVKPHRRPAVLTLGLPKCFIEHGATNALFEHLGLTPQKISATIKEHLDAQTTT
jgi:1-deoxy-D-xylulose-5-phosphate synthase